MTDLRRVWVMVAGVIGLLSSVCEARHETPDPPLPCNWQIIEAPTELGFDPAFASVDETTGRTLALHDFLKARTHVYRLSLNDQWELHSIFGTPPPSINQSVQSILVDGPTTVLLGRPGRGTVEVFEWLGDSWALAQTLVPSSGIPSGFFGQSMAMHGDRLIVGAPFDGPEDGPLGAGAAYVFSRGLNGAWVDPVRLESARLAEDARFGRGVAIYGNRVAAGSFGENTVELFDLVDGTWSLVATLGEDVQDTVGFGWSIDLAEDRVAVQDPLGGVTGDGACHIFRKTDERSWKLEASIDGAQFDNSGLAIWFGNSPRFALGGDRLVTGAFLAESDGIRSGKAFVYEYVADAWRLAAEIRPAPPAFADLDFGLSVIPGDDDQLFVTAGSMNSPQSGYVAVIPDLGIVDCDCNGIPDPIDIELGSGQDLDGDGVLDACDCTSSGSCGDADGDGQVDFADVLAALGTWGPCSCACRPDDCGADFDHSGDVTLDDLLTVLGNWTG